jgi:hypothetical protein
MIETSPSSLEYDAKSLDTLTSVAGAPSFEHAAILTHTHAQIDSSEHLNITVPLTYSGKPGEDANESNADDMLPSMDVDPQ